MSDAILVLQLDHRNLSKVLDLIQQQVTYMIKNDPVNYRLLASAFEYLSDYPEQCHHPKEDVVYRKLLSRFPDMTESLKDLAGEHEKMAIQTRELSSAIAEAPHQSWAANDGLADRMWAFLDSYRGHMLMEEQHFFPLALQRLSRNDFAEIEFTLFDQPDPLFNRDTETRFAELRAEITRLAMADKPGTDERQEAQLLASFEDIATFNVAMTRAGEPVCLTRRATGGFELDRGGEVLLRIPSCSESRAAWCAYYFWKGTAVTGPAP